MTFATTHIYSERKIIDPRTFIEIVRFIIVNLVLILIFLFLTLEEFEWAIFSTRNRIKDKVIDETPWDIKI
tara:strand:+ start:8 stop:220 length:213 start_codon:yes stop_codon:yes gene_type:complete